MVYGDPEERLALNHETLRLAQAAHDKRLALRAHLLLFDAYWERGDVERGETNVRAYESLAREFSHGAFHWTLVGFHVAPALWTGRFEEAELKFREAQALARKDDTRGTSMAALPAGFACAEERYEGLAEVEFRTREAFGSVTHDLGSCIAELLIARVHARARDRAVAAQRLAAVRAHPVFSQIREPAWLALLVEACHLLGEKELASSLYDALEPRAERFYHLGHLGPWCEPPYSRQLGLLAQTMGRHDDAVRHLTHAEGKTAALGMNAHLARLRLELAEALLARGSAGDRERAEALLVEARTLAEELKQRALVRFVDARTSELHGGPDARRPPTTSESTRASSAATSIVVLQREGDYWTVAYGPRTVRLRSSRGLRVLDQLLASPGQEFHVLQLVSPGDDDLAQGDAGTVLDSEAIQSYRKRLLELREELEEAEGFIDHGRSERAKSEIDFLTKELARAVGLGGRERRVGNPAERARTTVQKRVREAIRRIEDELPEIGSHLEQAIRTGTFCGYFPNGRPRRRS
jgi:tetratricopeptide (TPR) repeat protein